MSATEVRVLRCPVCHETGHPGELFANRVKQGHPCKPCANERLRARRAADHRKDQTWRKARYDRNRKIIHDYKMARGCAHCGYRDHVYALELHHVDPSNKRVVPSRLYSGGWSLETIAAELEKCIVLCANCHRVETYPRGGESDSV